MIKIMTKRRYDQLTARIERLESVAHAPANLDSLLIDVAKSQADFEYLKRQLQRVTFLILCTKKS